MDLNSATGTTVIRRIEFGAWFIELLASLGWVWSWYTDLNEELAKSNKVLANRGYTLDDPDVIAIISNIMMVGVFFVLNVNILLDMDAQITDYVELTRLGDSLFIFNAWMYMLASLRDCDCFWFMPHWGEFRTLEEIILEDTDFWLGPQESSTWFERSRSCESFLSDSTMEEESEQVLISSDVDEERDHKHFTGGHEKMGKDSDLRL